LGSDTEVFYNSIRKHVRERILLTVESEQQQQLSHEGASKVGASQAASYVLYSWLKNLAGRRFMIKRISFFLGFILVANVSTELRAGTLQEELDRSFASFAKSCLGSKFKPNRLRKQTIQGREIRTAIPDDFLNWDTIDDYLFRTVEFDDDGALDLEFSTVFEVSGGELKSFGTPLELFWDNSEPPLLAAFNDSAVRHHNCITLVKATSSFNVGAGFLSAAADASVDSERAVTTFAYAGRVLSPYAWAANLLQVDGSKVQPTRPRASYLLRIWEWYGDNPDGIAKSLSINTEITGIGLFRLKELTQEAMMETQAQAGFGIGPFSSSANAEAALRSSIQSQVDDFESAVLNRDATNYLPKPKALAKMIRDEIRLSASLDNAVAVGDDPIRFVASLPLMTSRLCVQSAWKDASTGSFTSQAFVVEATASGGCRFSLTLVPPETPSENLFINFSVETPVSATSGSDVLKFELPRETFSDNRLLISFASRPRDGITLAPQPLVNGLDYDLQFSVYERDGARLGNIQPGASRATIACDDMPVRDLPLNSVMAENASSTKIVTLRTRIDAGLLNGIEPGEVAECAVTAWVRAERFGPGSGVQTFSLPTARFVVRKENSLQ